MKSPSPFSVGDAVQPAAGGLRMKVESIDKDDGRITCCWKRGPALHRKKFLPSELMQSAGPALAGLAGKSTW